MKPWRGPTQNHTLFFRFITSRLFWLPTYWTPQAHGKRQPIGSLRLVFGYLKPEAGMPSHFKVTGMLVRKFKLLVNLLYMWVWLKLQLTPKGDLCVVNVRTFFVNFSMYSIKWYLNWTNKVTFHPKHPNWNQNLQFTPQRETMGIPITVLWELPPWSPTPGTPF